MQQFFRIHVTPDLKPTPMEKGQLDENGNKFGSTEKVFVNPPIHWFPMSYTKAVKKVREGGKYHGKIEFCKPNEPGAEVLEIHYQKGCPSLDRKWQEDNGYSLKRSDPIEMLDTEAEIGREYLANTVYDFDVTKEDKLFIEFLKHHDVNGTNPNRDQNTRVLFIELDGTKAVDTKKEAFKKEEALFNMKSALLNENSLVEVLSHVFDISTNYDLETRRDMLLEMLSVQGEAFIESTVKAREKIVNQASFLFKDLVISMLDKQIVLTSDKTPIHSNKFSSDKSSKVVEELAKYSLEKEENYLEWLEIEKKLLK